MCDQSLSHVWLFATPWTIACWLLLSMEFYRQKYSFPPPRDLPDPGIEPVSPASPELAGIFFTTERPRKPQLGWYDLAHMWRMLLCCNKKPLKCPKGGQVLSGFEHSGCWFCRFTWIYQKIHLNSFYGYELQIQQCKPKPFFISFIMHKGFFSYLIDFIRRKQVFCKRMFASFIVYPRVR